MKRINRIFVALISATSLGVMGLVAGGVVGLGGSTVQAVTIGCPRPLPQVAPPPTRFEHSDPTNPCVLDWN
jgi:hypothetical protein